MSRKDMTVEDMFYALGIIDYMREHLIKRIDAKIAKTLKKKGEKKHEKPDGKKTEK